MDAPTMGLWLMMSDAHGAHFQWPEIKKCAAEPIPRPKPQADGGNSMLSREWKEYEMAFQRITLCRNILAARHDGWAAATDKPDPFPPEPMLRPDDLK